MQRLLRNSLAALLCLGAAAEAAPRQPDLAWPEITSQQKPWAYWWWMGSAVDENNIQKELTRYRDAGLGGVHIIPIYGAKGWETNYITYLSPRWMQMLDYTVSEAQRLGLGVDMTTGSGWCFGGPQVTDEDANASVVVKTYGLGIGERLTEKFNKAATQALVAYGPDGKVIELTDNISAAGEVDWTAPAKVGQASRLPSERDSASDSGTGILPVSSNAPALSARPVGTPVLLSWTVYAISQKPSGQKVKRPGPGGEGWMLNLIYPPAMDDFLKPYTAAFANYHGPKPRAQYHDSYEYRSDWSPGFFAEFEKRRGYKLQNELPALFPDSRFTNHASHLTTPDHRARVLCDYRQTVSEIMAEESLPAWTKWSHDHGFITRNQAHGSPGNWLDLYAAADIPETEMFHTDRNKLISKFASSAAHVTGKPLVSAETGTWIEEHFTEKLSDVKYLMDDLFLSGVNHLFYHGVCYSPDEAGWPGWHFYASLEMNPRNSIWRDAPALNAYAARCQAILQSGQPYNDILIYWPITDFWMQPGDKLLPQLTVHARDWFEGQPIGRTAKELWERGYAFDYVSDAQLKTAKVVKGKIQMPGGKYRVIVVPECKFIPLETFRQLVTLAQSGVKIVFEKDLPADISGLADLENRRKIFQELKDQVTRAHITPNPVLISSDPRKTLPPVFDHQGSGYVYCNSSAAGALDLLFPQGISEDDLSKANLSHVRRIDGTSIVCFIANRTGTNFDGWLGHAAYAANSFVLLDPMTGKSGVATRDKHGRFHLQLAAGESVILRASLNKVEGPAWTYWQPQTPDAKPQTLTTPWNVKFLLGGPTLPADFQTAQLASWTTFPDTNCQAFAGTAKYETTFDAPRRDELHESQTKNSESGTRGARPSESYFLNLGDVRQSARVRVNGKDYGTLITPPFRVVVDNLKPTGNTLEVEVTSTDANRIRDLDRRGVPWKTFRDINIVNINYKPFDASDWPLTDCGLLGPVTLTPVSAQ